MLMLLTVLCKCCHTVHVPRTLPLGPWDLSRAELILTQPVRHCVNMLQPGGLYSNGPVKLLEVCACSALGVVCVKYEQHKSCQALTGGGCVRRSCCCK